MAHDILTPEAAGAVATAARTQRITLISFGFKYGQPPANHFFDVSFLKNPAREARWDLWSKPSPEMREFVLAQPACRQFLNAVMPLLEVLMSFDDDLRVAFGCSSGRHRSAIVAEEIKQRLEGANLGVKLVHREETYQ